MPQFARPDADVNIGNWTDESGGVSNLFQKINESIPDDAGYVQSEPNPAGSVAVFGLSDVTDPQDPAAPTVRFRARKDNPGGADVQLLVEIREGYVDELNPGTIVQSFTVAQLPDAFTDFQFDLDFPIGDFTNLFLRLVASQL